MSYKIYAGTQSDVGVWDTKALIYDPTADDMSQLLISPALTREAGKAGSLEFTLPLGNIAHSSLQKLKTVVEVKQDEKTLWCGRVMSHDMDFLLRQKVYCEGDLAYLNDSSLKPYRYKGLNIQEFMDKVLSNHNSQVDKYKRFTLGNVTVIAGDMPRTISVGYATDCEVKENDDGGYCLVDADGNVLCDLNSDLSNLEDQESEYIGSTNVIKVTKNKREGTFMGKPYTFVWYVAELTFAYQDGITYDLKATQTSTSRYVYSIGDVSELWRVDSDETIWFNKRAGMIPPTPSYVQRNYYLQDVDMTGNESITFGDGKNFGTTWDILQSELTDVYGGYFAVRYSPDGKTRYLDYLSDDAAEKNTQTVEFGVNMLDLDSYVRAENIVTRVIAVGYRTSGWWIFKSTSTISATANDLQAQKLYGKITRVIVVDGKSSTSQKLLDAANDELKKNLRYVDGIEVNAVDLRDAGIDTERLGFMKSTHIISKPHGLDAWVLCTKIEEPLDAPEKKKFTFGNKFYSISDLQALSSQKASMAYSMALSTAGYINKGT